jgi:hypothetical protein
MDFIQLGEGFVIMKLIFEILMLLCVEQPSGTVCANWGQNFVSFVKINVILCKCCRVN